MLLRPGKEARRTEPAALAPVLESAGVPVAGEVAAPAVVEGGDTVWLDDATSSSASATAPTTRRSERSCERSPRSR